MPTRKYGQSGFQVLDFHQVTNLSFSQYKRSRQNILFLVSEKARNQKHS